MKNMSCSLPNPEDAPVIKTVFFIVFVLKCDQFDFTKFGYLLFPDLNILKQYLYIFLHLDSGGMLLFILNRCQTNYLFEKSGKIGRTFKTELIRYSGNVFTGA